MPPRLIGFRALGSRSPALHLANWGLSRVCREAPVSVGAHPGPRRLVELKAHPGLLLNGPGLVVPKLWEAETEDSHFKLGNLARSHLRDKK